MRQSVVMHLRDETLSVRDVLDQHRGIGPGFHFLRHVLAVAIVLWHCRQAIWWSDSAAVLTAQGKIATGIARAGDWNAEDILRPGVHSLVGLFFALSGFLVMGSALRTRSTPRFLTNRALRIFPALAAETLLSAFVLGPIATTLALSAYFRDPEFYRYFGNIIGWLHYTLPGVFEENPYPRIINGQLWTLQPEFWCYLIMAALMAAGVVYRRLCLLAIIALSMIILSVLYYLDPVTFTPKGENFFSPWYITLLFWIGAAFFHFSERIPVSALLFAFCVVAYWSVMFFNIGAMWAGLPLTYIMVYLGMMTFTFWDKIVKVDYSYGIYLYHFPLIQAIMWLLSPTEFSNLTNTTQLLIVFPLSLILSIAFAALSWRYIEKPALSLKKILVRTSSVAAQAKPAID